MIAAFLALATVAQRYAQFLGCAVVVLAIVGCAIATALAPEVDDDGGSDARDR